MDALVEAHQPVLVVRSTEMLDLVQERLSGGVSLGVETERGELRGVPLELGTHLGDADDVGGLDRGDERAAARLHVHEVLEREALDRLSEGSSADAEITHQLVLAKDRARREMERHDLVAQFRVRALGHQPRGRAVGDLEESTVRRPSRCASDLTR